MLYLWAFNYLIQYL